MKAIINLVVLMIALTACVTVQANQSDGSSNDSISSNDDIVALSSEQIIIDDSNWPGREPTAEELMPPSLEPLDAVAEWMIKQPAIVANSTIIRQEHMLADDQAPVLLTFNPQGWDAAMPALALFQIEKGNRGWLTKNHDYNTAPEAIDDTLTFHNHHSGPTAKWSAVYGLTINPQVSEVMITWSDGVQETVAVENNTYLGIRSDNPFVQAVTVVALDGTGNELAQHSTLRAQGS